jgi:hypothetical protein
MAGAGVVPCTRAFLRLAAQDFVNLYLQTRSKLFQEHCRRGAHDACADKKDMRMVGGLNGVVMVFILLITYQLRRRA